MPTTGEKARNASTPPTRRYTVDAAVADVLRRSRIAGSVLSLPDEQLERPLYVAVDKVLRDLGGKWDRRRQGHVFPDDQPIEEKLRQVLGEGFVVKELTGYFPTPPLLAAGVVTQAEIAPGHLVLEPSAGQGALADLIAQIVPADRLYLVESLAANRAALERKGYQAPQLILGDFLSTTELPGGFDRIVMNPPFERCQDVSHVQRAWELLAPGGRLVAIMSQPISSREDAATSALRALLSEHGAAITPNPKDSFKASGASGQTVTVVVDKP